MVRYYRVFRRSCTNWKEFAQARKTTVATGQTIEQARAMCDDFNANRTPQQVREGTKLEFESE